MSWKTCTLDECISLRSGSTPSKQNPSFWNGTIPWASSKELKQLRLYNTESRVTQEAIKSASSVIDKGTVLIVVRGMVLAKEFPVSIAQVTMTFNQDLKAVDPKGTAIDRSFLPYLLLGHREGLRSLADEAAHGTKRIQTDRLLAYKVELPSPEVQKRIASILSAYDDLIENNTRRIEILEEMARRLYEEWFVQFRFPGHEGVEFTDSSLGLIPVGWTVGCLQDVITLQRGFDLPLQHRIAGSVPIISATGIGGSHVEAKVKGPGVVTGRSGSIGKVMYVHDDHWPLNTALWGANYPLGSTLFAYYVLSSIDLKGFNVGAAVPTLNRNDIHGLPVNIPPKEIVQSFEKVAEPLHNLTEKLRRKNANLRAQRDLLLPKLISGEIDVSDIPMPT